MKKMFCLLFSVVIFCVGCSRGAAFSDIRSEAELLISDDGMSVSVVADGESYINLSVEDVGGNVGDVILSSLFYGNNAIEVSLKSQRGISKKSYYDIVNEEIIFINDGSYFKESLKDGSVLFVPKEAGVSAAKYLVLVDEELKAVDIEGGELFGDNLLISDDEKNIVFSPDGGETVEIYNVSDNLISFGSRVQTTIDSSYYPLFNLRTNGQFVGVDGKIAMELSLDREERIAFEDGGDNYFEAVIMDSDLSVNVAIDGQSIDVLDDKEIVDTVKIERLYSGDVDVNIIEGEFFSDNILIIKVLEDEDSETDSFTRFYSEYFYDLSISKVVYTPIGGFNIIELSAGRRLYLESMKPFYINGYDENKKSVYLYLKDGVIIEEIVEFNVDILVSDDTNYLAHYNSIEDTVEFYKLYEGVELIDKKEITTDYKNDGFAPLNFGDAYFEEDNNAVVLKFDERILVKFE